MYKILSQKPILIKYGVVFLAAIPGILSIILIVTQILMVANIDVSQTEVNNDPQVQSIEDALSRIKNN